MFIMFSQSISLDFTAVSALSDSDGRPRKYGGSTCIGTNDDVIASFSNYGKAVDIAAPGGAF
jgi:hypothetical protein